MFPTSLLLVLGLNPKNKVLISNDNPMYFFETLKSVSEINVDISTVFEGDEIPAISKIYVEDTCQYIISVDGKELFSFDNKEEASVAFAVTVILHQHFKKE